MLGKTEIPEKKRKEEMRYMQKILIVVDMQKDFISGALGTREANNIVSCAVDKINSFDGDIIVTYDTHDDSYMTTQEGRKLPVPHCIKGRDGWELDERVQEALSGKDYVAFEKSTFGSVELIDHIRENYDPQDIKIELIGVCTDICVVSNALLIKAHFVETEVSVDADCCAGVTPQTHKAALDVMKMCQIDITEGQEQRGDRSK